MNSRVKRLEQMRGELCHALGDSIWAFALIERLTYRYMQKLSYEPLHELMADQSFNARVKLIKQLVGRLDGQDTEKAYALKYIKKAQQLAETRNMIAHNPWTIRMDWQTDELKSVIRKFDDNAGSLDLDAVRQFALRAREAASGLEQALDQLQFPASPA